MNRSRTLSDPAREKDEMTTPNEALKRAANSPAGRQAAETARSARDDVTDFADDLSRTASKQYARAQAWQRMRMTTPMRRSGETP